jgi:hypothetical protein
MGGPKTASYCLTGAQGCMSGQAGSYGVVCLSMPKSARGSIRLCAFGSVMRAKWQANVGVFGQSAGFLYCSS